MKTAEPSKFTHVKIAQLLNRKIGRDEVDRFEWLTHFTSRKEKPPKADPSSVATSFASIFAADKSAPSQTLKEKFLSVISPLSGDKLERFLDDLIGFVRSTDADSTAVVRASSIAVSLVLVTHKSVYSHYYSELMRHLQSATSGELANLIAMNVASLVCLKQHEIVVSFLVDLIGCPTVPMLLIACCMRVSALSPTEQKYATFLRLVRLLVAFECSSKKHANNRQLFANLPEATQMFWLGGRHCGNFEPVTDLGVLLAVAREVEDEFETVATKANFSFLQKIIRSKYS